MPSSEKEMIKPKTSWIIILVLVMCFISFWLGRKVEFLASGYTYSVRTKEEIPFKMGMLFSKYVTAKPTKEVFLDPGTTQIEFQGRSGVPVLLYSADRGFQESRPFVRNIKTEGNQIYWEDGFYRFVLIIEEILESQELEPDDTRKPM